MWEMTCVAVSANILGTRGSQGSAAKKSGSLGKGTGKGTGKAADKGAGKATATPTPAARR